MKKILYHGGSHIIETPEIRTPERTLDFGRGFYTTTSSGQAERLVRNRIGNKKWTHGYVNTYLFDIDKAMTGLNVKRFIEANHDWVDFVLKNRMIESFTHDFDIVIGPVAEIMYTANLPFLKAVSSASNLSLRN